MLSSSSTGSTGRYKLPPNVDPDPEPDPKTQNVRKEQYLSDGLFQKKKLLGTGLQQVPVPVPALGTRSNMIVELLTLTR